MRSKSPHTVPRFLAAGLGAAGDRAVLPRGESHHLARVLRLGPGDRIAVFDGKGREFLAEVAGIDRAGATVTLLAETEPAAEPRVAFAVVQAVLKGTAMDDVVRDATMVGARTIEPVLSRHVAAGESALARPALVERWRRVALASAKQCRRAVVPDVSPPRAFEDWLRVRDHQLRLLFVEPAAARHVHSLREWLGSPAPASAALVVGPEGGWSEAEVESAVAAGCIPVTLGRLTLRADAVALAAASLVRFVWEDR